MKEYFKEQIENNADIDPLLHYVILKFKPLENGFYEITGTHFREFKLSKYNELDFDGLEFARIQKLKPVFRQIES